MSEPNNAHSKREMWLLWVSVLVVLICQVARYPLAKAGWTPPINWNAAYAIGIASVVIWHAWLVMGGWRTVAALSCLMAVGFTTEALGVNFGLVYGPYHYSDAMGARLFGVPPIVPVSWVLNIYPAFFLARYLIPTAPGPLGARRLLSIILLAVVAGLFSTMYDLIADPAYIYSSQGWIWHTGGDYAPYAYGGIPIQNFVGWIITGVIGSVALWFIADGGFHKKSSQTDYTGAWIPLTMYLGAMIMPLVINALYIHDDVLYLFAIAGMGTVVTLILAKYFSAPRDHCRD
ncbi:carotenoid biosynthesis protein [Stutzerimonas nitrititolerans]|uniref:carotenoid biosynthesis protein n=1 Tax=Stutzerimonas nitrititolerans TaxID=2482751 RepID=UPI002899995D|nr:carotenoid biosynthesis protein [Stutzerimonas nitrititolerans]